MPFCPACGVENIENASACAGCGHALNAGPTPTLTNGAVIAARYEIASTLGKGGMGMVFKAHDRVLDETVALKILRPDIAGAGEMLKRFRSEIKLARKVRHKNVCGIHEYGEEGNLQYIAMEFVQGIDLKRLLKEKGTLPLDESFSISIQLARGLQAIHEVGIIHRDLKTANAMIDNLGIVRLMDFGIAKKYDSEGSLGATAVGHIVGTPEYMSPEQARGEKVDFRSDIYALGVMIYEIFTGHVPFQAETPIATIFKHLQDPPPLDEAAKHGVPAALINVLSIMLAKDVQDRYANARLVVEALRKARASAIPEAGMTPVPGETVKVGDDDVDTHSMARPTFAPGGQQTVLTSAAGPQETLLSQPTRTTPQAARRPVSGTMPAARAAERNVLPWLMLPVVGLVGVAVVAGGLWLWKGQTPEDQGATSTLTTPTAPWITPLPTAAIAINTPNDTIITTATVTPPPATPAPTAVTVRRPSPAPPSTLRLGPSPSTQPTTPRSASGTFVIIVRPWAKVSIDDQPVGTTPMKPLTLPVGKYFVTLDHPGYKPVRRKIIIEPGRETQLEVDLHWEAVPK